MSNIEPCLEIDPSKFVFVIGPSFTKTVLKELSSYASTTDTISDSTETAATEINAPLATRNNSPTFELSNIVTQGVGVLLETEVFQSEEEKLKCEVRYKNAYELDPLFAYRKVAANLQKTGKYEDWLKRSFEVHVEPTHTSPSLLHLIQLQKKGALLLYVHCDDVLSKVSKTPPILLEDAEGLELWFRGERDGFLHVHGVYWQPYTVKLDCDIYDNQAHQLKPVTERLKQIFDERQSIMIGFDQHVDDPLLSKFLEKYITLSKEGNTQQSFHLTPSNATSSLLPCLPISVIQEQKCTWHPPVNGRTISTLTESSVSLWRQIEFPVYETKDNNMMGLLVTGKQGAVEISRMMFNAPGVNFALVSSVQYGPYFINTVSIRVQSARLKELWLWVFENERELLLSKGLLAIVMDSGTFVWLRGKPMTGVKPVMEGVLSGEILSDREAAGEVPMDTALPANEHNSNMKSILAHKGKSVSPLVGPEFTLPKGTSRKKPRYTVHKFRVKQGGASINMNINGISSLRKHQHNKHSYDDNAVVSTQGSVIPKSVFARRCSLPPNIAIGPGTYDEPMDSTTLGLLAENLHSTNPHLSPPSYVAIKQALLTDKFKRRPSMQTDPKMLKNLLQSKLIISEKNELLSQRRNSDPGLYLKQRDFERRKELFVDENRAWASSFGAIIEKKIRKWEKQKKERQFLAWKNGEISPRGFHLLNSHLAQQQSLLNPLQQTLPNGASAVSSNTVQTLLASNYATAAAAGMGMSPFIFPQAIYTPTTSGTAAAAAAATGTATPSMFYGASPYITPYTYVNPYTTALQLGQLGQQPTAFYIPQQTGSTNQQNLFYFIPSTSANTTTLQQQLQPIASSETAENTSSSNSLPSSTPTTSSMQQQLPQLSSLIAPNPRLIQPLRTSTSSISSSDSERAPDHYDHRPISPNSRKRHQSVPEKLTSLLQVPTPTFRSASPSMEEDNIDSPPSVKKQRSTSDTMVYYTPYGYAQLSPHRGVSPQRNSTSPQPPEHMQQQPQGLSPLQTHLLQVHSIPPTERRRKHGRSHSPRNGTSPRRGQDLMQGQVQEMDEQEAEDIVGGALQSSSGQQKELPVPAPRSSLQLWQFLLELLLISANTHLIQWTDSEFEFQINKPSEVAQLWGQVTNNPTMNYEKLARGLRYYYSRGIMNKVPGKKLTFKYAGNVRNYVQMRKSQMLSTHEEVVVVE